MNPACTARGIRRWCARWASWIVFARLSSWSSLRRSRGRFLRKSRAIAASPERASSISAEHTAAASAALRSVKAPRKTPSATSSSLSCLRPAMSRPRGSSRRSRTAPNCSSTSTTLRNSCQYALLNCSSARRRTPRRSVSVSSSRHSRSHLGWAPQGHRWHSIDESTASGPCARSRSRSSGTDSRASSAARWRSPRPSRPRSRGTEKGGVAQKIRLTTPLFARTTAPWGRSASMSTRWPRIEWTPRISARPGAPEGLAPRLRLLARAPVASDALEVAARRLVALDLREGRLEGLDLRLQLADALEVLVLAERRLDPSPEGLGRRAGAEEKRGGAVAELELALDRLGRAVHDAQEILHAVARVQGDHALALGVDPAAACAPGHLGQLVVRERPEAAVGALGEALEHDAARRHVDPERHRLGGEDDSAEPAFEEQLYEPLEARQDPGMVEANAEPERLEHRLVQQRLGDRRAVVDELVDRVVHVGLLRGGEEALALGEDVVRRALAADAAEDEVDRGEPAARLEPVDQDARVHHPTRVPAAAVIGPTRLAADQTGAPGPHLGDLVDLPREVRDGVRERHGAVRVEDRHDRPVHDRDPVGDLLDVRHGRRQADEEDVRRRVDDDLLPDGAARLVAHVVTLVQDDVAEVVEPRAVERVPEDLGPHDEHTAMRVHLHVAREDADRVGAERPSEVVELLVRERLERRGVRDALARRERHVDGELGDERLPRPGRRRHDDGLSAFDRADGFELEVVERERVPGAKLLEQLHHSTQYHEWSAASAWLLRPSAWQ